MHVFTQFTDEGVSPCVAVTLLQRAPTDFEAISAVHTVLSLEVNRLNGDVDLRRCGMPQA